MKRFIKKVAAVSVIACMAVTMFAGCGKTINGTETAITVNGENVTLGTLSFMTHASAATLVSYYGSLFQNGYFDGVDEESGKTKGELLVSDGVDSLENAVLFRQKAQEQGITLTEDELAKIDETAQKVIDDNDPALVDELGFTKEDIAMILECDTYRSKMLPIIGESADVDVNQDEYQMSKLSLISINVDENDEEKTDAKSSENINKVYEALEASDDPATVDFDEVANSVDETYFGTSFFMRADGSDSSDFMSQEVYDAVKGLKEGENTGVLYDTDKSRYCILRLDSTYDEDATKDAVAKATAELKNTHLDEVIAGWKEESDITVNEKAVKQLEFNDKVWYQLG